MLVYLLVLNVSVLLGRTFWQWHLARQGGHAPCPICRKIISKKDLFQVSNKKIDTSATNDAEQAQKTPNNEGTRGELDDENVLDLLTEQLDRPEDDTDKAERVCLRLTEAKNILLVLPLVLAWCSTRFTWHSFCAMQVVVEENEQLLTRQVREL